MKIENKFEIGQVLWAMYDNQPCRFIPDEIIINYTIKSVENLTFTDTVKLLLFKPKQFILKKKIEYTEQYHCMRVTKQGTYGGVPFYFNKSRLFATKQELLNSL